MNSLSEAKKHIDSFSRPTGYNMYAWNVAKKMALEVWDCYLNNRPFTKTINYFCKEFYLMIRTPEGRSLVSESRIRSLC